MKGASQMSKVSLNELAALSLILDSISVKDFIHAAMNGFSDQHNVKSQDSANICSEAISAFLK
jgi:hypothetical protein